MLAALAVSGTVRAQEAATASAGEPDTAVEQVVVVGFRSSLAKALNVKRNEAAAVDMILAEDIGKFPDLNLSESLQRIPGVSIARDGGEGRQISVRGLGPQFTRVRINGMEALTTAGGADSSGGTNRGRSFDFNIFASDLFSAITVRKTASADVEEGSLGATVDLRTARPFDFKGFKMSGSAQGSYNDLAKTTNPRAAFMISNTWKDDTFGALFSFAYAKRNIVEEGNSTVRWAKGGFGAATTSDASLADINAAYHPRIPRYDYYQSKSERFGATLALQWRPSDDTLVSFDSLYADLRSTREEQYIEAISFSSSGTSGIGGTTVTSASINNGVLTKGTFDGVDLRVEDRFDKLRTKFTQNSLTAEHRFSDSFKVDALVGHSVSDHKNPIQTTLTFDQNNVNGYSYDYTDKTNPTFNWGTADLTSASAWTLSQIRLRPQTARNTYDTAQVNAHYTLNSVFKLDGGLDFKKYEFVTTELRRSVGTTTNQETVIPAGVAAISLADYSSLVTIGGVTFLAPDLSKASSLLSLYSQTAYNGAFALGDEPALGNNRGVREKDSGGYVQASFETSLANMPFRGNFGVRYVKTEQSSNGYTYVSGSPVALSTSRSYDDTLPSMNLVLEPTDNFLVRFGAAKVMSRPDLGNLTPGATVSVSGANRTVSVGNPNLDPFRANAYDLSLEWYFQPGSLLGVAVFRKDVGSFVQTVSESRTFTGNSYGLPDSVATAACGTTTSCSASSLWTFSRPVNTKGGALTGVEVNYQQAFKFLPGLLANTGVLLNYTYVKSEMDYVNSAGAVVATADLTGLSRNAYNATVYYEDAKWSARASIAYRDRYLTKVPGAETASGTAYDGTNSTFNVDASLQYTVNDNLKLTLEGVNLTDEYQYQFNGAEDMTTTYHHTGREILVGVRYTF
ncbi:TonB-dependent receptor [Caulobacter segnis]|uniref:TonB-dependent receptor n=1 Tax=Caulobacter segnis TaxID=88688 RepID=UPI001CBF3039|nr:TonB-dependent receptor [Caulobacter segnis]UAL08729.1 TonB-dependent receptor [Caulobacter segnis]